MNLIDEISRFRTILIKVRTETDIPSGSVRFFLKTEKELIELEHYLMEVLSKKYNFFIEDVKK